ncbi:hypothetical protein COCHEDRAFT_1188718 [Bipolaris maydis C5]|uniref:Uncharacterized protein n=1 Tax=Cochliobolus heterostrophus (strain C5 / ATCC 48332 / race O) TaxID=701091 RepID=M2TTI3_COCH5|nr:hypothetical protein COCHEDRAFT_1188718 [Bipolaris maydis C5]KAJ6205378.1 hypothetical protein PSV09DRAFT_1188718 [Bipolaris maydis]
MGDTPKKRRKERSPDSGAATPKRTRMHSTSSSTCSRSDTQPMQDRTMSRSKDDDWNFRIKVLSAANCLNNDLFRDAVKGLVRICFPDGILKQLGQHVIEQHMREERAKPANIQRTMEAFQPEMIRRLIGMLAEYFDTPDQAVSAVQAALGQRRKTPNDEETTDSSNTLVEQSLSPKKKRRNRSRKLQEATPSRPKTPTENTVSNSNTVSQRQKDRKISSSWDWNIDPDTVTEEAIQHAFPRTADLFAYHTLPTTQQMLGSRASRKEMLIDMQSLLDGLSQKEFQKWVESLDKLCKGNRGMLVRPELTQMNNGQLSRHIRVAIESLFGSWSAVSILSGVQVWRSILEALEQRGLSEQASVGAVNIDCLQIDSLCNNCKFPEVTRRALLERIFRRLVFLHKDKFPELKETPVVKVWERKTGLEW